MVFSIPMSPLNMKSPISSRSLLGGGKKKKSKSKKISRDNNNNNCYRDDSSSKSGRSQRDISSSSSKSGRSSSRGLFQPPLSCLPPIGDDLLSIAESEVTDLTLESQMTSKSSKKKSGKSSSKSSRNITDKNGIPWIVDEHGHKIKKVRKKVRRRASIGHSASTSDNDNDSSSIDQCSASVCDMRNSHNSSNSHRDDPKMTSFRTEATELSSSHFSASSEFHLNRSSRSTSKKSSGSGSHKKKSSSSKKIREIDGQLWRCDKEGYPLNKVRKKGDRLSQTEHTPTSPSLQQTPSSGSSSKKKKKKALSKSKSVRHVNVSSMTMGVESDTEDPLGGTVSTTGTNSLKPRPKPRRLSSQPNLTMSATAAVGAESSPSSPPCRTRAAPKRTPSGDLDMLMSQSVHEHIRRVPHHNSSSTEKPKLGRSMSTLGKMGKMIGKSSRVLSLLPGGGSGSAKKDKEKDKLPPDIREIDGVLWRLDEYGNKLNKVRRKSGNRSMLTDESRTTTGGGGSGSGGWSSSGDDNSSSVGSFHNASYHGPPVSSSTSSSKKIGGSDRNFFRNHKKATPPRRVHQRRNSMGSHGMGGGNGSAGNEFASPSGRSMKKQTSKRSMSMDMVDMGYDNNNNSDDTSDASMYLDNLNDLADESPQIPKRTRSKSIEPIVMEGVNDRLHNNNPMDRKRRDSDNSNNSNKHSGRNHSGGSGVDNHKMVQSLQHRLKGSEKEIARLCRVHNEQQEKIDDSKSDLKKMRTKLKAANHEKQSLVMEVDALKMELERKNKDERKQKQQRGLEDSERSNSDQPGSDQLLLRICELENVQESLRANLKDEKALSRSRCAAKEEEVRFLQDELERMRSEQGEKQLQYMQQMASTISDDNDELNSSIHSTRSLSRRNVSRGQSMQFVGKILGNHMQDKAATELALMQEEVRNLQDRVGSLQMSNEKLKVELKKATLEIKDDDDEDIRRAKEAAAQAVLVNSKHHRQSNDLKAKVMNLSRLHRSTSDQEDRSIISHKSYRLNRGHGR